MIKEIHSLKDLKEVYRPEKATSREDTNGRIYACVSIHLQIGAYDKLWFSKKWFITDLDELVFDIPNNRFVNMRLFDKGTSSATQILADIEDPFSKVEASK